MLPLSGSFAGDLAQGGQGTAHPPSESIPPPFLLHLLPHSCWAQNSCLPFQPIVGGSGLLECGFELSRKSHVAKLGGGGERAHRPTAPAAPLWQHSVHGARVPSSSRRSTLFPWLHNVCGRLDSPEMAASLCPTPHALLTVSAPPPSSGGICSLPFSPRRPL